MFYKKNNEKELDKKLFKNPTSEYRGTPFWAWNCELDKEDLLWQIEQLKEMGFGGFHMHSRDGMATNYLSDDFFDLIKACVDKAEKEDMLAYLYDEDRWPSGAAGGIVTKNKKYAQRNIRISITKPKDVVSFEEAVEGGKTYFICACDVSLNEKGELLEYDVIYDVDAKEKNGSVRWYVTSFVTPPEGWFNNESYIDTLSKEAIDKFIETTHEAYKKEVGEKFGESVPSIFTDEPQFTRKGTLAFAESKDDIILPWTFDFDKTFKAKYGYSILEKLPELFWDLPDGAASTARYNYHDHVTDRFVEAFADNCGEWCEENGIKLTGHVMEEPTLGSQCGAVGEAMRAYRKFGIPGMDLLCDYREFTTAKQVQSAVRQYGKEGMLSELYGVTNWDFDFRGHKFQGDWQAALGVTIRVPHLSWVSMKGSAKRDYPASINYQSAWYKEYKYVEDHFARVNTALTRGKAISKVAVIHPIETYWLHWGPTENTADVRNMLNKQFEETNEWLLSGLMDFDYISESLLPEQIGEISDELQVGEMSYKAVVISGCETLRSTTLDVLEKFQKAGGKIIFVGEAPKYEDAKVSDRAKELYDKCKVVMHNKPQLLSALEEERFVDIRTEKGERTDNLLYQLREDVTCKWLFIAHMREETGEWVDKEIVSKNIVTPYERRIIINGEFTPVLYDTITGEIKKINFEIKNGKTIVYYTFFALDSLLLKLSDVTETSYFAPKSEKKIFKHIRFLDKVKYSLSEENVLLLDIGEYRIDDEKYNEKKEIRQIHNICSDRLNYMNNGTQPWAIEKEIIKHSVTIKYEFESEIESDNIYLATEDYDVCNILFNGEKIENKYCGYFTDKSIGKIKLPKLLKGNNVLEITYPFGARSFLENCFILGDFNVKVEGVTKTIVEKSEKIGFGDITSQGMPFYGANITYEMEFDAPEDCDAIINVTNYNGTVVKAKMDGKDIGIIAYSPYDITVENVSKGSHKLEITLYASRNNSFGALHITNDKLQWFGPGMWESNVGKFETANEFIDFKYEYILKAVGVMASPEIKLIR